MGVPSETCAPFVAENHQQQQQQHQQQQQTRVQEQANKENKKDRTSKV
jgi:hypothetical protein